MPRKSRRSTSTPNYLGTLRLDERAPRLDLPDLAGAGEGEERSFPSQGAAELARAELVEVSSSEVVDAAEQILASGADLDVSENEPADGPSGSLSPAELPGPPPRPKSGGPPRLPSAPELPGGSGSPSGTRQSPRSSAFRSAGRSSLAQATKGSRLIRPLVLPNGMTREDVARNQRARMYGGMIEAVHEHGYQRTHVAHVIALAGVSRRAFYEQFANKEACFIATYDI